MLTNKTREEKVVEFHEAMSLEVSSAPRVSLLQLRKSLMLEEMNEVVEAIEVLEMELERGKQGSKKDWAHLLKELADLQYVLSGTLVSINPISNNFEVVFNRVHRSNMSKLNDDGLPIYREDGKVTKGPNYQEPYLEDLIS
jgi:predicted HAD superfamily Cof-like phosphohydrolase|tara:strand:- start:237 stop:659 length:423 start_codon:yes stop_codon:yes gene_type:complete